MRLARCAWYGSRILPVGIVLSRILNERITLQL